MQTEIIKHNIKMEPSLYSYSLIFALPLMLFFGVYLLLFKMPEKSIFRNYLRSRRIMGVAMLLLAVNYSVYISFSESGSRMPMLPF